MNQRRTGAPPPPPPPPPPPVRRPGSSQAPSNASPPSRSRGCRRTEIAPAPCGGAATLAALLLVVILGTYAWHAANLIWEADVQQQQQQQQHDGLNNRRPNGAGGIRTKPVPRQDPASKQDPGYDDGSFAGCLLVMDDNHYLAEWLAYHYFALPLRDAVVAADPRSRTSPAGILRAWREHGGLRVRQWRDGDYMTWEEFRAAQRRVRDYFGTEILDQPDLVVHRARQRLFYYKCIRYYKQLKHGPRWLVLIDTDEFLHVNYQYDTTVNTTANDTTATATTSKEKQQQQPVRPFRRPPPPPPPPRMDEPGSVAKLLRTEFARPGNNNTITSSPCIQIPRIRYGAKDGSGDRLYDEEMQKIPETVGGGFNASHFQTLRWTKRADADNFNKNRVSKTILDLSRIDGGDLTEVDSIHRPIKRYCGHRRMYIKSYQSPLQINHYLGTYEQYSYRNDSRIGKERSRQMYNKAKDLDQETNYDIVPWLRGFIRQEGIGAAQQLLQGVGVLE